MHSEELIVNWCRRNRYWWLLLTVLFPFTRKELCAKADSRLTSQWRHPFTCPAVVPLVFISEWCFNMCCVFSGHSSLLAYVSSSAGNRPIRPSIDLQTTSACGFLCVCVCVSHTHRLVVCRSKLGLMGLVAC